MLRLPKFSKITAQLAVICAGPSPLALLLKPLFVWLKLKKKSIRCHFREFFSRQKSAILISNDENVLDFLLPPYLDPRITPLPPKSCFPSSHRGRRTDADGRAWAQFLPALPVPQGSPGARSVSQHALCTRGGSDHGALMSGQETVESDSHSFLLIKLSCNF